jgi:hypothetical protein
LAEVHLTALKEREVLPSCPFSDGHGLEDGALRSFLILTFSCLVFEI